MLSKAVAEFATLAVNLRVQVNDDKQAAGGINGKVLEFLAKGDEATVAMAERVQNGDSSAIRQMQQAFMDDAYPGLNLESLMDDDFVKQARNQLLNDEVRFWGGACVLCVCWAACVFGLVWWCVANGCGCVTRLDD